MVQTKDETKAVPSPTGTDAKKPVGDAPVWDLSKKKKKKKPKSDTSSLAGAVAALNVSGTVAISELPAVGDMGDTMQEAEDEVIDFPPPDYTGKKKRWTKRKVIFADDGDDADGEGQRTKGTRSIVVQPWDSSDRDYTYSELINRAFQFLHGKNPALASSAAGTGRKKISLQLPQVAREGTKKTVFLNFGAICKQIHRQQDHLLQYLGAELGTTGNIQDGGRLVIKGRFTGEAIVKVIKRYMGEYVICSSCRSPDTVLMRDACTRLYFVSCETCGARRSVLAIRQGFMAQVERRKRKA